MFKQLAKINVSKQEGVEDKREKDVFAELEPLKQKWSRALKELAEAKLGDTLVLTRDGNEQAFYVLQRLPQHVKPGETVTVIRALSSDFRVYEITQTVQTDKFGLVQQVSSEFKELKDPRPYGITAESVARLVKEVCEGNTPFYY